MSLSQSSGNSPCLKKTGNGLKTFYLKLLQVLSTGLVLLCLPVQAENWPTEHIGDSGPLFELHQKHLKLKENVSTWLKPKRTDNLIAPDKDFPYRKLALVHPETGVTIPLLGSQSSETAHGRSTKASTLPVTLEFLETLKKRYPALQKQWLYALTDSSDQIVQPLLPAGISLSHHKAFKTSLMHGEHLDLTSVSPKPDQEFLGLADITQKQPYIFVLDTAHTGPQHITHLPARLADALQNLPDEQKSKLALVTGVAEGEFRQLSRVLMPVDALITQEGFITDDNTIAVSTVYPPTQLNIADIHRASQTPDQLSSIMSSPPTTGARLDVAIAVEDEDGETIYHRIAGLPHPEQWVTGEKLIPTGKLSFTQRYLLQLSKSPLLRQQALHIVEHHPDQLLQDIYPLSRTTINQQLLHTENNNHNALDDLLQNPFDFMTNKRFNRELSFQLPGPRPEKPTSAPITLPLQKNDSQKATQRTKKIATTASTPSKRQRTDLETHARITGSQNKITALTANTRAAKVKELTSAAPNKNTSQDTSAHRENEDLAHLKQWIANNLKNHENLLPANLKGSTRNLALLNLATETVTPILANTPSSKDSASQNLPISQQFLNDLQPHIPDQNGQWFYIISDEANRPIQILTSVGKSLSSHGLYKKSEDQTDYLDIDRATLRPNQEAIGLVNMTDEDPWVILLNSGYGHQQAQIPVELINSLWDLPQQDRDKIALATVKYGVDRPHMDRLLMPISGLTTRPGFVSKNQTIVISTQAMSHQLTTAEYNQSKQVSTKETPETHLKKLMSSRSNEARQIDLAISTTTDTGEKIYPRIATMPHPGDWTRGKALIPSGHLDIPLKTLMAYATSSYLKDENLYIVERFPLVGKDEIHPITPVTLSELLTSAFAGNTDILANTLDNPFDIMTRNEISDRSLTFILPRTTKAGNITQKNRTLPLVDPDAPPGMPEASTSDTVALPKLTGDALLPRLKILQEKDRQEKAKSLEQQQKQQREEARAPRGKKTRTSTAEKTQTWLAKNISNYPGMHLPTSGEKEPFHRLALVQLKTSTIIPLLSSTNRINDKDKGENKDNKKDAEPAQLIIPVSQALLDTLKQRVPALKDDWYYSIVDSNNTVVQLLLPSSSPLNHHGAFQETTESIGSHLDLTRSLPKAGHEFLGLTMDITQDNPQIIVLNKGSKGPLRTSQIPAALINTLKKMPAQQRARQALVTGFMTEGGPKMSRLLLPVDALTTHNGFVTDNNTIAVSLSYPARQLNIKEVNASEDAPPISPLNRMMATLPERLSRFEIAISISNPDNPKQTTYQRIAGMPDPAHWQKGKRLFPDGKVIFTLKELLTLAASPQLRNESLYLVEEFGILGGERVYELSQGSIYSFLLQAFDNNKDILTHFLDNSFDIAVSDALQSQQLECPLPEAILSRQYSYVPRGRKSRDTKPSQNTSQPQHPATEENVVVRPSQPESSRPLLDISQAKKVAPRNELTGNRYKTPATKKNNRSMRISDLKPDHKRDGTVDNANQLKQIDAEQAQHLRDKVFSNTGKAHQPTPAEMIATAPSPRAHKAEASGNLPDNRNEPDREGQAGNSSEPRFAIKGHTEKKHMDMLTYSAKEREAKVRKLQEQARSNKSGGTPGSPPGGDPDDPGPPSNGSTSAPISNREREEFARYIDVHPVEQAGRWALNRITQHPLHTLASGVLLYFAFDLYKQWTQLPGPKELLIKNTLDIMGPEATPFWHEALEHLVKGTPDELVDVWRPDTLNWWVAQACQHWCSRHTCNARHLSDVFMHYVLSPVSGDKDKLRREIQLRISEEPIQSVDPWLQAVAMRRQGQPAALDFDPVTRHWWMATLDDYGLLVKAYGQDRQTHLPVKVMRRSFLETVMTTPQHKRYQEVFHQGLLTDATNQYRPVIPYPMERQRYGVYTCATTDGDNWWAIDLTGDEPGLYGVPAIIGYAHQAANGLCVVNSMDKWLSIIHENGAVSILNPDNKPDYPIRLSLQETFKTLDKPVNGKTCRLQFWKNRHWHEIPLQDFEPGTVEADLPQNSFFRVRCHGHTATFTLDHNLDLLDIWSWPPHNLNKP